MPMKKIWSEFPQLFFPSRQMGKKVWINVQYVKHFVSIHLKTDSCSFHGLFSVEIMTEKAEKHSLQRQTIKKRRGSVNKHSSDARPTTTKTTQTDTEVQGQNTSGFESTGEPASSACWRGRGGREQRLAKCVSITAGRGEEPLEAGQRNICSKEVRLDCESRFKKWREDSYWEDL